MDPVTLIVDALTAGAVKGVGESAAAGVKDAYAGLKHLVSSRFAGRPSAEVAIAEYEADPDTWRVPLVKELQVTRVADDQAVVKAAQRLMALLDEGGARAGKYVVNVQGSQGVVIGDHSHVVQTFTVPPPA